MNRLSKKFVAGISIILIAAALFSILFNTCFLAKYYVFQKKSSLNEICDSLSRQLNNGTSADKTLEEIEKSQKVIIARIDSSANMSNDEVNDALRTAFQDKGIGFQKYWLWEKDLEEVLDGNNKIRLYHQENLNYSLLVEYVYTDAQLFAVTMIVPDIADAFDIINTFLILVNIMAIIMAIIFIMLLIKKITKPLSSFEAFAARMGNNEFVPLHIHTGDELEAVAGSLNTMGSQLISYQHSLREKNKQMEQLLDNVAHDLKTPLSLIQLYATGIRDGLDDGTFLDTIITQNQQMSEMVSKLLYASQLDKTAEEYNRINITALLNQLVEDYSILAREHAISLATHWEENVTIMGNDELLKSLLTNLITNAIHYSSSTEVAIELYTEPQKIRLNITNETENDQLDLNQIWNPYYVREPSRNKKLSGTGLGLSIVKKICDKLQYSVACTKDGPKITFSLIIPIPSVPVLPSASINNV